MDGHKKFPREGGVTRGLAGGGKEISSSYFKSLQRVKKKTFPRKGDEDAELIWEKIRDSISHAYLGEGGGSALLALREE